jgi:hypothetical protein
MKDFVGELCLLGLYILLMLLCFVIFGREQHHGKGENNERTGRKIHNHA